MNELIHICEYHGFLLVSIFLKEIYLHERFLKKNISHYFFKKCSFLGGLSLHLNHLIASHLGICYRQFGTLPIGIFLSNLDSRQLDTSLMTSYGHF